MPTFSHQRMMCLKIVALDMYKIIGPIFLARCIYPKDKYINLKVKPVKQRTRCCIVFIRKINSVECDAHREIMLNQTEIKLYLPFSD